LTKKELQRYDVLDCKICRVGFDEAIWRLQENIKNGLGGYVCFSNVHTVVMSRNDVYLRNATNNSFMSVPDGKPLMLVAKFRGLDDVGHVPGPSFMPHLFSVDKTLRHYFYGSTHETLNKLVAVFKDRFPESKIVGHFSPPFRELSAGEEAEAIDMINNAKPDVIWVGLGAPKQEYWMAKNWGKLKPATLLGVGAAFDINAGIMRRAPYFMRALSMEWVYRLCQEPRRLWKRYLVTNTLFLYYLFKKSIIG
jgi:N-acetylglucosaminyldiphosphoundecaprenol N-acetyl-beta-D-mannosaminyltransferase